MSDSPASGLLGPVAGRQLLELARQSLVAAVREGAPPEIDPTTAPPWLGRIRGCFITLTKQGELRGCVGQVMPLHPLGEAVIKAARSAALRDSRFSAVEPGELPQIRIEVSVLTEPGELNAPSPEALLGQLRPGEDGVVLRVGSQVSTFLPKVWDHLPDKVDFLNRLAQKAGCAADAWRQPGASISIYQAESFSEG